jgi:hypothetical protein
MLNGQDWGYCDLWLEIGPDGYATRQIEIHDNGRHLRYNTYSMRQDEYSVLDDQLFCDPVAGAVRSEAISNGEGFSQLDASYFELVWESDVFSNGTYEQGSPTG